MIKIFDFECDCGFFCPDVWVKGDVDQHVELCAACGNKMEVAWNGLGKNDFFPEFTTNHLKHLNNGQPVTFKSLREIRAFERAHADRNLTWEVGSFDNAHYGEE